MKKRIVCFGDSNTWGFDSTSTKRFSDDIRWTKLVEKSLNKITDVEIIEEGLVGRTSVLDDPLKEGLNGIDYIYPAILTNAPIDLLIIMLGTNDSKERYNMTSYDIASGIIRLANKARITLDSLADRDEVDSKILIIAPARIGSLYKKVDSINSFGKNSDLKTKKIPIILEKLSKENNFYFLNADEEVCVGDYDYVHLDEKGHENISKIITKKIIDVLEI